MMNLDQFPHTKKVLNDLNIADRSDEITWHHFGDSIDDKLADVIQTFKDLTSSNIPVINEAKQRANREFILYGNQLHIFAKEEARHQLHLTNEDVTEIFAKVEIGGTRFIFEPPTN